MFAEPSYTQEQGVRLQAGHVRFRFHTRRLLPTPLSTIR
jgi:hypothetical protein